VVAINTFWDERKLLVFVALIIAAAGFMLLEIDASRHGRQSVVDVVVGALFTPLESGLARTVNGVRSGVYNVIHSGRFAAENRALTDKTRRLAAANERLKEAAAENRELRRLVAMKSTVAGVPLTADVIGYTPEATSRAITIDRGTGDGVRRDSVVVAGDGLVGHVLSAGPHAATVLLIIDPQSSVPAYLARSRSWGIVAGTWLHVKMKYIDQKAKPEIGDLVVTGRGEIYPGGIPIGRVREIDRKDNALYQTAVLDPAVDFSNLTHVLVYPAP